MSDISEFESRINAALARIRKGVDRISDNAQAMTVSRDAEHAPPFSQEAPARESGSHARILALEDQLNAERMTNTQLEERVQALKDRQDGKLAELQEGADAAKAKVVRFERDLLRLRDVNAELREINAKLRKAIVAGLAEPDLINTAMQVELEALSAVRDADATEIDSILDALKPLIEEAR